jgi:uncharacterized protein YggE
MRLLICAGVALAAAPFGAAAQAQQQILVQPLSGTRLDLSVAGEVTRVPDLAIISAGS